MDWDPSERSTAENYRFFTSAVAPRPIAWVTSTDATGRVNLAPFSWYQSVCADPPMLMLSFGDRRDGTAKDTLRNIRDRGEFVVHMSTRDLAEVIVASSVEYPPEVSEVQQLGLKTRSARRISVDRLADSPVAMECVLHSEMRLGGEKGTTLVIGEVVWVHADDDVLSDGAVDPKKATLLARLGGRNYAAVTDVFQVDRPKPDDSVRVE